MKIEKIRKINKSKMIIGGLIGLGVVGAVTILPSYSKYRTTQSINLVKGKITYKEADLNLVAMYITDGSTDKPIESVPGIGYELETTKSKCRANGQEISASIEYDGVKLLFDNITQKGTKCNVYFKLTEDSETPQITNVEKTSKEKTSISIKVTANDNVGITEYWYSINTVNGGEYVKGDGPTYTFSNLTENTEYTIKVKVKDAAGNEKEWSGTFKTEASVVTKSDIVKGAQEKAGSFEGPSSASDKGLFKVSDGDGDSYYYRGLVENNYVKWAGKCWRIVRFNGDGSIRIIYDGTTCSPNGSNANSIAVASTAYNTSRSDNAYVGFKYGSTYSAHTNTNKSNIMTALEKWYDDNNIGTYIDDIDTNVGFCNDRNTSSGTGIGTTATNYAAYGRLASGSPQKPILSCTNSTRDLFTPQNANKGNGLLEKPIGLITADEVVFAGGYFLSSSTNYWLYNGQWWWTMSPYNFSSSRATVFRVGNDGDLNGADVNNTTLGVRPVINLKAGTVFKAGTTGEIGNEYEVVS